MMEQSKHGHFISEGVVIDKIYPQFMRRRSYDGDLFYSYYNEIRMNGNTIRLPYKELFGSGNAGEQEYIEGKNLSIEHVDLAVDLRSRIKYQNFDEALEKELRQAAEKGYTKHPPKQWLTRYMEYKDEHRLVLYLGQAGYLEHRIYREEILKNPEERAFFEEVLKMPRGNNPLFDQCPWANCGGGCWVITKDNYLAISQRVQVMEEPDKLGYSSSGSFERYIDETSQYSTPGLSMTKEIEEELGLPRPKPDELTLISLGIDIPRNLIQFSYAWRCPYTADKIRYYRANQATTADEQIVFYYPLDNAKCWELLINCEFEPGAAFSLCRILEKNADSKS